MLNNIPENQHATKIFDISLSKGPVCPFLIEINIFIAYRTG
ncbi:hypothetical protein ACQCVP_07090 [Rossellomorea vietnamensis]